MPLQAHNPCWPRASGSAKRGQLFQFLCRWIIPTAILPEPPRLVGQARGICAAGRRPPEPHGSRLLALARRAGPLGRRNAEEGRMNHRVGTIFKSHGRKFCIFGKAWHPVAKRLEYRCLEIDRPGAPLCVTAVWVSSGHLIEPTDYDLFAAATCWRARAQDCKTYLARARLERNRTTWFGMAVRYTARAKRLERLGAGTRRST
jgi:hypothetical protein